jgi:hypothetical protein
LIPISTAPAAKKRTVFQGSGIRKEETEGREMAAAIRQMARNPQITSMSRLAECPRLDFLPTTSASTRRNTRGQKGQINPKTRPSISTSDAIYASACLEDVSPEQG